MPSARSLTVVAPSLKGELLPLSLVGREALSEPFEYKVELLASESVDVAPLLGQPLHVELSLAEGARRQLNGVVTHLAAQGDHGRYLRYEAWLRPSLWLLSNTHNCRIFQGKDVPSVALQLLDEHGVRDLRNALTAQYEAREYLVQYRESDLAFMQRILEEEGIYFFFEHREGKHVLVLADALAAHSEAPGYEQVPYYPALDGRRRERDHIDRWLVSRQLVPAAYAANGFNFERSGSRPYTGSVRAAEAEGDGSEVFEYPGVSSGQEQADARARLRLEALQLDAELVRGSGDARGLEAGALFTLTGYPRDEQNRRYLLLETQYRVSTGGYESAELAPTEEQCRCEFVAMDAKRPFRPARRTRKPLVEGPQTAIVVGPSQQEIWTDEYGRVKLQFHWDRYGGCDQNSSCWVRVAQLWAGSGFGGLHLPRIGQEVIVDFLEGDPDRPLVVGRVYNADNMPPFALPANATQSGIKSRSTKGGRLDNANEIRFEDQRGREEVYVQAERDLNTVVKNDQSTKVGAQQSVSVGTAQLLSVGTEQLISVGTNQTVSIGANRTTTVLASDACSVQGSRSVAVSGSDSLHTQGLRTMTHDAGRIATVKAFDRETIKGDKATSVEGGAYGLDADGLALESRGGFQIHCPSGTISAGPPSNAAAGGPATLVSIQAQDALVLSCGEHSIVISKSGISISSPSAVSAAVGGNALDLGADGAMLCGKTTIVTSDGDTNIMGERVNLLKASKPSKAGPV